MRCKPVQEPCGHDNRHGPVVEHVSIEFSQAAVPSQFNLTLIALFP